METWKPIPGIPFSMSASSLGRVRREGFLPKIGSISAYGYRRVYFRVDGKIYRFTVSRLVCAAFHGPAPSPKMDCMHINDNRLDNRPENLQWGTRLDNMNTETTLRALSDGWDKRREDWLKRHA